MLAAAGILVTVLLARSPEFNAALYSLGNYGYIGAFFAGMLFVLTFTASTGALILAILFHKLTIIELTLLAGVGSVISDLFILKVVRDGLLEELEDIYKRLHGRKLSHLLHVKTFRWTLPVLGAIIIASPFPDELGVSLMGISRLPTWKFIILSYVLNSVGIFIAASALSLVAYK